MKGLKKLALATAVAAAPFAQAELTAMDDALLEEMTGQAGITIDVDLDMSIDAIKYVDQDGDTTGTGVQGAITMKGLNIDNDGGTATIRGITIDADGTDGLVMGLNQIGDDQGNGIDITIDAVMINDGSANLHMYETAAATTFVDQGAGVSGTLNVAQVQGAIPALTLEAQSSGAQYIADRGTLDTAADAVVASITPTGSNTYSSYADLEAQASTGNGDQAELDAQTDLATVNADGAVSGPLATANASALAAQADQGELAKALAVVAPAGAGNIGGFKIENFRNYIQNSLVEEYNARFDMALQDSAGNVNGVAGSAAAGGRFVRGEIVIQGTGNYVQGTSGLRISGEFGGAIDEAAWVDEGQEFGVADMGFFHGVDTDADGISDTIEGMHFTMDINVVDHASWNGGGATDVAALEISGLSLTGTIMMGELYLDSSTAGVTRQSLGSVLVKDIDMSGTSVYIYGH